jgi:hypothetical protein
MFKSILVVLAGLCTTPSLAIAQCAGNNGLVLGGYIGGLTMAVSSTSIQIFAGAATSDDSTTVMAITSAGFQKNAASQWAAGSGNGALDNGTLARDTWYHVFLIERLDTCAVDALVSTSAMSPALPANYGVKRRIGSIRTDPEVAMFIPFEQNGDEFLWYNPGSYPTVLKISTTPAALTLNFVPSGIKVNALIHAIVQSTAPAGATFASPDANAPQWNPEFGSASLSLPIGISTASGTDFSAPAASGDFRTFGFLSQHTAG